jgi:hypothetical protein
VVDRATVEPRRRPGLEPPQREAQRAQVLAQLERRRLADPTARAPLGPGVQHPAQESPGGHDHRVAGDPRTIDQDHPAGATCPFSHVDTRHHALHDGDHRVSRERGAGVRAVAGLVDLDPGRAHRRALAAVQDPAVDRAGVGGAAHEAAERLDLLDEVPLRYPADARVAGASGRSCRGGR